MRGETATAAWTALTASGSAAASLIALLLLGARRVLDRDLGSYREALDDLDAVDAREAGLDLPQLERLLPRVLGIELRRRRVLLARREDGREQPALVGRLRRLGLLDVDDLGLVLLEDGLDRHREHLLALLADHVDVGRHPCPQLVALAV